MGNKNFFVLLSVVCGAVARVCQLGGNTVGERRGETNLVRSWWRSGRRNRRSLGKEGHKSIKYIKVRIRNIKWGLWPPQFSQG